MEVKATNQSESYTRLGENSCGLNWLEALPIHQFSLVDIEIAGGEGRNSIRQVNKNLFVE
ncbi:MAG: hypothetical protein BRC34_09060 [Cyanobacteria bacterium QH_1_48_107]|nr:MAG: hypothetical protein BRC34_09060 [Cyanobacteria bacterium QH_1_48_107]